MTTPSERRRALRWMRQSMIDVGSDPGLPVQMKAQVDALLQAWPADRAIATCFMELDNGAIDGVLAQLKRAQDLMSRASRCSELTEESRRVAQRVLRHFPQPWELDSIPSALRGIDWSEFYLLRGMSRDQFRSELEELGYRDVRVVIARIGNSTPLQITSS